MKELPGLIQQGCPSLKEYNAKEKKKVLTLIMKLVKDTAGRVEKEGEQALELGLPFPEIQVLKDNIPYIQRAMRAEVVRVFMEGEESTSKPKRVLNCMGRPLTATFEVTEQEHAQAEEADEQEEQ
tara:strand:- start:748 stop:1122 length:375 start_codon:yes stop_codon:yes gene_type:complete